MRAILILSCLILIGCSLPEQPVATQATVVGDEQAIDEMIDQVYAGGTPTPTPAVEPLLQEPTAELIITENAKETNKKMNQHTICLMVQLYLISGDLETFERMAINLGRVYPDFKFSADDVMRIYVQVSEEEAWCDDMNEELLISFYELVETGQIARDNDAYLAYLRENS